MSAKQKPALRVLIIEDNEDDALLLLRVLKKEGFAVTHSLVDDKAAVRRVLKEPWDLVLSDYSMPSFTAIDALKLVRKADVDLPFIIVSGVIGEDTAVAAMRSGAHDYFLKNNLTRLGAAVRRELAEADGRRARRRAETALAESAKQLRLQKQELEQKNLALREILAQIEAEKDAIRKSVIRSADRMLLPVVNELRRKATRIEGKHLDLLEKNVRELTSEFGVRMTGGMASLTPRQLEICNMIRSGMESKEIAEMMGVALRTVETHRNAIRKKLGISGEETNLATYLQSMT
jgi:DNA-binding NarL/FixJ family response regulator